MITQVRQRATRLRRLTLVSTLLMLGSWLPGITGVAEAQWLSVGPPGGYAVSALAAQPGSSEIIYAGTFAGGVFKSTNRGTSWTASNTGLGDLYVTSLVMEATAPLTVYAGTQTGGVFKSTNGAATWIAANNGLSAMSIPYLAMGGPGSGIYAGTNQGVFKSMDGAATWTLASDGLTHRYLTSLAVDPISPSTLYAGTPVGVFKSVNGGGTWAAVYGKVFQGISALGISPTATSTVYAGTFYLSPFPVTPLSGYGILKSADGGASWAPANNELTASTAISSVAVDPRYSSTVYAGSYNSGVFKSIDSGSTWTAMNENLANPYVFAILIDPQGTIYAGTAGGVFRMVEGVGVCTPDGTTLCLNSGRFQVRVAWRAPTQGSPSAGTAAPLTADAGTFWFFSSNNVELVVKVVDGRAFNNKFWIFYGALTNVEYTITVTDTQTGAVKTYFNPQGQLASVADTAAF